LGVFNKAEDKKAEWDNVKAVISEMDFSDLSDDDDDKSSDLDDDDDLSDDKSDKSGDSKDLDK